MSNSFNPPENQHSDKFQDPHRTAEDRNLSITNDAIKLCLGN